MTCSAARRAPSPAASSAARGAEADWEPGSGHGARKRLTGNEGIYVMNADGSRQRRLTRNATIYRGLAWSPDGRKIAFASDRRGNFDIYVMNADGSGMRRLTGNPAQDTAPAWSPDGRKIAFASGYLITAIYVMNADGSGERRVMKNADEAAWAGARGRRVAPRVH